MATSEIATAADYADAMLTARRAKNWLFLLLVFTLVGEVVLFLCMRHWPALGQAARGEPHADVALQRIAWARYFVAVFDFLGVVLVIVLALVLLLLTKIMLVGRLIGVSRVTSAYIWTLVLAAMLFPWQSVLSNPTLRPVGPFATTAPSLVATSLGTGAVAEPDDFVIPGVLYTWGELIHPTLGANFDTSDWHHAALHWARYIVFPVAALIILLMIQGRSSRGLKQALGEAEDPALGVTPA